MYTKPSPISYTCTLTLYTCTLSSQHLILCTHVHENVMYMYIVISAFRLVAITQSCTPQHVHPYINYKMYIQTMLILV